jgi:glutamyl/glutaminyl-tRNA synthetase
MEAVRTRYALSPTGFMHIGNLRSVIFEYLMAKYKLLDTFYLLGKNKVLNRLSK